MAGPGGASGLGGFGLAVAPGLGLRGRDVARAAGFAALGRSLAGDGVAKRSLVAQSAGGAAENRGAEAETARALAVHVYYPGLPGAIVHTGRLDRDDKHVSRAELTL